jgi:hypothetical protein
MSLTAVLPFECFFNSFSSRADQSRRARRFALVATFLAMTRSLLAERMGFEPTVRLPVQRLSNSMTLVLARVALYLSVCSSSLFLLRRSLLVIASPVRAARFVCNLVCNRVGLMSRRKHADSLTLHVLAAVIWMGGMFRLYGAAPICRAARAEGASCALASRAGLEGSVWNDGAALCSFRWLCVASWWEGQRY